MKKKTTTYCLVNEKIFVPLHTIKGNGDENDV